MFVTFQLKGVVYGLSCLLTINVKRVPLAIDEEFNMIKQCVNFRRYCCNKSEVAVLKLLNNPICQIMSS